VTHDQETIYTVWAYLLLAGGAIVVLLLLRVATPLRWRRLLPLPRLRPASWSGAVVLLLFFFYLLMQILAPRLVRDALNAFEVFEPPLDENTLDKHAAILSAPLFVLLTLPSLLIILRALGPARPNDIGLSFQRAPANISLGLLLFLILTPPIEAFYELVTRYQPAVDYPFKAIAKQSLPSWEWLLLAFQLAIAAPLLEEIMFRGALQGWLRRTSLSGHITVLVLTVLLSCGSSALGAPIFGASLAGLYAGVLVWLRRRYLPVGIAPIAWNYPPAASIPDAAPLSEAEWARWQVVNARLAVFGSAMLFAVCHSVIWPTPIPLFFLALALGWLAYRTQSLVGTITFHALFNAVSVVMLYWIATSPAATNGKETTVAPRSAVGVSTSSSVPRAWLPRRK
jgi:membrane protease YdiL (CAAX protease family)